MNRNYITVDIGTSSMKGAVINASGRMLCWGRVGLLEQKGADLEQWDPQIWVDALRTLIGRLLVSGHGFEGIVISGNGPTIVPVAGDRAIGPALLWLDKRSIRKDRSSYYLHKVLWYRDNRPDIFSKTEKFLGCAEYINYLLCGEAGMISPWEEFDRYIWEPDEIAGSGIDAATLPPVVRSGECLGTTGPAAEALFGLPPQTRVYASGSDFHAALVGTAAVKPGRTCDRAGTSEGINYCSAVTFSTARLRPLPHTVQGLYNIAGILESSGMIFQWFRKITTQEDIPYEEMLERICGLSFHRSIPRFFPSTHKAEIWQFANAMFTGLQPMHTEVEMGRAVVEAIGFAVKDLVLTLADEGCRVESLTVSGGQGRNSHWNQMKADITGCDVLIPAIIDAELLGNVCIALKGQGEFSDLVEAADSLVSIKQRYYVNPEMNRRFTERYIQYREKCDSLMLNT
ncbi:MAG: FGGY-family carbohydrate kinase [Spirochaetales bacterium]|nr:FGGY-family carbohydrate kinase [Spirochaetales bacterium]